MKKIIVTAFLSLFTFFFFAGEAKPVMAVGVGDLNVSCDGSSCTLTPSGQPLFQIANFWPGQSATRTINVFNSGPDDCNLLLDTKNETDEDNMAPALFTVIKSGGTDLFGVSDGVKAGNSKNLDNVYGAGWISLGTVGVGVTKAYNWTVTMNPLAGNAYQGRETVFDFDLNFSCGVPSGPSNPSNPSPSNPSAPTCSDATPQAPSNLTAVAGATGQVILSWSPPSSGSYTYFLVAYSDSSSWPPKWGNPNVGNVTSYTVSGLGTGSYWFWVRSGNGCQPGPYIGPVPITISGIAGVVGPAAGFAPGVLGTQENLNTGVSTQAAEIREVKGAATCECFWWPLLVLQAGLILLKRKNLKWAILISIFIYLLFLYLNRNCGYTGWCLYFWLLDLGVLLILRLLVKMIGNGNSRKDPPFSNPPAVK